MEIITRQSFDPPPSRAPDVAVYFDIFRASTTLAALLSQAPAQVVTTNDRDRIDQLMAQGYQLISEVFGGGLDNSPTEVLAMDLRGQRIVHKSTNLTTALLPELGRAGRTLVGGFVNLTALVDALRRGGYGRVELVAAAHVARRAPAVEDSACVEMVARLLEGEALHAIPDRQGIEASLAQKRAIDLSRRPHYFQDTALALTLDRLPVVPEARLLEAGVAFYTPFSP